jgi:hypothetical protein
MKPSKSHSVRSRIWCFWSGARGSWVFGRARLGRAGPRRNVLAERRWLAYFDPKGDSRIATLHATAGCGSSVGTAVCDAGGGGLFTHAELLQDAPPRANDTYERIPPTPFHGQDG